VSGNSDDILYEFAAKGAACIEKEYKGNDNESFRHRSLEIRRVMG